MKWTTVTIFYKKPPHLITLIYSICPWFWVYIKGKHKQSFCQMHVTSLRSIWTRTPVLLQRNAMSSESHCVLPLSPSPLKGQATKRQTCQWVPCLFLGKIKNQVTTFMKLCITVQLYQKDTAFAIHCACGTSLVTYQFECAPRESWWKRLRYKSASSLDQDKNLTSDGELWSYLLQRIAWVS